MNGLSPPLAALLADALLLLHFAIVAFNVIMVPLAWFGHWRGWRWVRRRWVRRTHIGLMALIALVALAGELCPLTTLEQALRERAGQATYAGSFVGRWVGEVLYLDLPAWVFPLLYAAWFALTLWTWRRIAKAPGIRSANHANERE